MAVSGEEAVTSLIGDIYQAAYDPSGWQTVVDRFRLLLDGSKACLASYRHDGQAGGGFCCANTDPFFNEQDVVALGAGPFASGLATLADGTSFRNYELLAREDRRESRFWNEWLVPQDMFHGLGVKLLTLGSFSWFIDASRSPRQDSFGASDQKKILALAPHIRRAIEIGHNLQISQALSPIFQHLPFGMLVVTVDRRIVIMNAVAEEMIARPQSRLQGKGGMLKGADATTDRMLERLVGDACYDPRRAAGNGTRPGLGGDFLLAPKGGEEGASPAIVSIGPLVGHESFSFEHCAVVALRERALAPSPTILAGLFDLTPGEVRLASALAQGQPLKAAALSIGLTYSSARTYLERIFAKTGTHSQTELVALLASTHTLR